MIDLGTEGPYFRHSYGTGMWRLVSIDGVGTRAFCCASLVTRVTARQLMMCTDVIGQTVVCDQLKGFYIYEEDGQDEI